MNRIKRFIMVDSNITTQPKKVKELAADGVGLVVHPIYLLEASKLTTDPEKLRRSFDVFVGIEHMVFACMRNNVLLSSMIRCWFSSPRSGNRQWPDGLNHSLTSKLRTAISSGNFNGLGKEFAELKGISKFEEINANEIMIKRGKRAIELARVFATPKEALKILNGDLDGSMSIRTRNLVNYIFAHRGTPKRHPLFKYKDKNGELSMYVRPRVAYELAVSISFLVFFIESNSVGRTHIPDKRAVNDYRDVYVAAASLLFGGLISGDSLPSKIATSSREILSLITGEMSRKALGGSSWYDFPQAP